MKIPAPGSFSPENAPRLSLAPLMAMAILHDIHRLDEPTFSSWSNLDEWKTLSEHLKRNSKRYSINGNFSISMEDEDIKDKTLSMCLKLSAKGILFGNEFAVNSLSPGASSIYGPVLRENKPCKRNPVQIPSKI